MKHVRYIRAHTDGEVYSGPGQCDEAAFEALKTLSGGEDLIALPPGVEVRMDDKIDRKTLKVLRKGPPKSAPLKLTVQEQRAEEYPPLNEFADAFYWSANGDEKPMKKWLAAVARVKAKHPK